MYGGEAGKTVVKGSAVGGRSCGCWGRTEGQGTQVDKEIVGRLAEDDGGEQRDGAWPSTAPDSSGDRSPVVAVAQQAGESDWIWPRFGKV